MFVLVKVKFLLLLLPTGCSGCWDSHCSSWQLPPKALAISCADTNGIATVAAFGELLMLMLSHCSAMELMGGNTTSLYILLDEVHGNEEARYFAKLVDVSCHCCRGSHCKEAVSGAASLLSRGLDLFLKRPPVSALVVLRSLPEPAPV